MGLTCIPVMVVLLQEASVLVQSRMLEISATMQGTQGDYFKKKDATPLVKSHVASNKTCKFFAVSTPLAGCLSTCAQ